MNTIYKKRDTQTQKSHNTNATKPGIAKQTSSLRYKA